MANPFDKYDEPTSQPRANPFDKYDDPNYKPATKGFLGHARDLGLAAAKSAIAVPEIAVGAADLLTGGRAGKALENQDGAIGFRPKQAKEFLSSLETDQLKAQRQEFADADGVLAKTGVALSNPSLIGTTVMESAAPMLAGGLVGRGVKALGLAKTGAGAAGIGEGAVMAGSAAEQIRQQSADGLLTGKQAALALGTGLVGAGVGVAGNKLGAAFGDVDSMLVGGAARAAPTSARSLPTRIAAGAAVEGAEELGQSVPDQVFQNEALGRPLGEGVADAAVMGTLAGVAMGGGASALSGAGRPRTDASPAPGAAPSTAPDAPAPAPNAPQLGFNPAAGTMAVFPDGSTILDSESSNGAQAVRDMQRANRLARVGVADPAPNSPLTNAALAAVDSGAHDAAIAAQQATAGANASGQASMQGQPAPQNDLALPGAIPALPGGALQQSQSAGGSPQSPVRPLESAVSAGQGAPQTSSKAEAGAQAQTLQAGESGSSEIPTSASAQSKSSTPQTVSPSSSPIENPIVAAPAPTAQERLAALRAELDTGADAKGAPLNDFTRGMRTAQIRNLITQLPKAEIEAARAKYDPAPAAPITTAQAAPDFQVGGVDEAVKAGLSAITVSQDGKPVPFKDFSLLVHEDGTAEASVERASNSQGGVKGSGFGAYVALGNELAARGVKLVSGDRQHGPGKDLWARLTQAGYAQRQPGGRHEFVTRATPDQAIQQPAPNSLESGGIKTIQPEPQPQGATSEPQASQTQPQQTQPEARAAAVAGTPGKVAPAAPAPRPATWRTFKPQAMAVARSMEIATKGMSLNDIVQAIDQRDTDNTKWVSQNRVGKNGQPINEGGIPFKTSFEAKAEARRQAGMRVVSHGTGFALANKTAAQIEAEKKSARRLSGGQTSPAGQPIPAHAFIANEGGLRADTRPDMRLGGNPRIGARTLFAGAGKGIGIEKATARLIEEGYLNPGASHDQARALIKRSLNPATPQYNYDGTTRIAEIQAEAARVAAQTENDAQAEAAYAARIAEDGLDSEAYRDALRSPEPEFEDYLAAQQDYDAPARARQRDELDWADDDFTGTGFDEASLALQNEIMALSEQADALGIDVESLIYDAHDTTASKTNQDYYELAISTLEAAIDQKEAVARGSKNSRQNDGQQGNAPATGEGRGPAPEVASAPTSPEVAAPAAPNPNSVATKAQAAKAAKAAKPSIGAGVLAQRQNNAAEKFISSAMEQFGLTRQEAQSALSKLQEMKLVKLNAISGQFDLKDGRFWDGEVLRRAAGSDTLTAPTAQDIIDKQDRAEAATQAEKSQQRAADELARRERERKDIAKASTAAADTFELGGNAEQNLSGQKDLLDPILFGGIETPSSQRATDIDWASLKQFRNALESQPFKIQGFRGLDIKTQRIVLLGVLRIAENSEVLNSVVSDIPVDVMNMLRREQIAPEVLFHDMPMLSGVFSGNGAYGVDIGNRAATNLVSAFARLATKESLLPNNRGGASSGNDAALRTGNLNDVAPRESEAAVAAKNAATGGDFGGGSRDSDATLGAVEGRHTSSISADSKLAAGELLGNESSTPKPATTKPITPAIQAAAILDAANITGKERIDAIKDVKKGEVTPDELEAAYPAKDAPAPAVEPSPASTKQPDNINKAHAINKASALTPAGALKADATNSKAASSVWYYQGDMGQLQFTANVTIGGQPDKGAAAAKTMLAQIKAAQANGWTRKSMRAGSLGTVWVYEKGNQFLTRAGMENAAADVFQRPDMPKGESGYENMVQRQSALAKAFTAWLDTLTQPQQANRALVTRKMNETPVSKWARINDDKGGVSLQYLEPTGQWSIQISAPSFDALIEKVRGTTPVPAPQAAADQAAALAEPTTAPEPITPKSPNNEAARAAYYTPGNVILSHTGTGNDEVLIYTPQTAEAGWQVKVQPVKRINGKWEKVGRAVTHRQLPDYRHMAVGNVRDVDEMGQKSSGDAIAPAAPVFKYAPASTIETMAQGALANATDRKERAYQRLKTLRAQVKDGRSDLRLELIKAESAHKDEIRAVDGAKEQIEKDANKLGLTTKKPPAFSRATTQTKGMTAAQVQAIADKIAASWTNAPRIVVVANMADPRIPQAARDEDQRQRATGATGSPEGFVHDGVIYLLADQLASPERAATVLMHEALGHIGFGVFGDSLKTILQQVATMRQADIKAKAVQYGLDMSDPAQRLQAAEEVLAEMAQSRPEIGFVKRAISAIRNWLRANVPGFKSLALTDADIAQAYLIPARGFIERGRAAVSGGSTPMFSRSPADIIGSSIDRARSAANAMAGRNDARAADMTDLTDEQRALLGKVGASPTQTADAIKSATDRAGLKMRQGVLDRYASLKELDERTLGADFINTAITDSSWVLAKMASAAGGALNGMMTVGRIRYNAGQKVIELQGEPDGGLTAVLKKLGPPAEVERFFAWVAANRASKLLGEDRENLFTPDEIAAGIKLNTGDTADGQARAALYKGAFSDFQKYRDDVLAIAEAAGIVSAENRAMWRDEFYVPFYRIMDEDAKSGGPAGGGGLSRQEAFKRLKGGKQNLNDLMENTLMNFHHLLGASLKNQAAAQAMRNAERMGIARQVPESRRDTKTSTFVLQGGKKVFYQVDDPLVFESLTALSDPGLNSTAVQMMSAFKRVFTQLTTVTPQFVIANTFRDLLQASSTSPTSKNIGKNLAQGIKSYRDEKTRAEMLASGGAFSFGHIYGMDAEEVKASLRKTVAGAELISSPSMIPGILRKGWAAWDKVIDASENISRAATYTQNVEQLGKLRAAFEARDVMDFSQHGAWPAVRFLIRVVPFLNARLQGLDKLYRSGIKPSFLTAMGKGTDSDKQAATRFATVTGALTVATLALAMANADDDEYQKLEDWQKDTYWFVRIGGAAFFLPKPFEVGAIATLAERTLQQAIDDKATGRLFGERVKEMLMQTFAFNPVPQMFQPALDVYSNKDAFTKRDIESVGMERLSPGLRARDSTTAPALAISAATRVFGDNSPTAISPAQADHLIKGYLGGVGASAAGIMDTMYRAAIGQESPDKRLSEYQPIKRFYRDLDTPTANTRYSTLFYDGLREANRVYADVRELQKLGRTEDASELTAKRRNVLQIRVQLNTQQRRLTDIGNRLKEVRRSDSDGEWKRRELDLLNTQRSLITERMGKMIEDERAGR